MNATSESRVVEDLPDAAGAPVAAVTRRTWWSRPASGRSLGWLLAAVAGGWLVSAVATLASVDWILLLLFVGAVASILRTGRNVLDRLMFSLLVVAGALVVGGVLFSLWPWGVRPFPVAGCLFTVLAVVAWLGGRAPRVPRGWAVSDLLVLGPAGFVLLALLHPIIGRSVMGRLAFSAPNEDRGAHFTIFDAIHRLQAYPYFDQDAARVMIQTPTESTYPPGSHFIYAMIDIFARSTTEAGSSLAAFNRYFLLTLVGFSFFVAAALWSARWLLTPLVTGWRLATALGVLGAVLLSGPFMGLPNFASDSQILGIAFVCMTTVAAARPPAILGERLLLLGTGVVLVAWTYFLYLPFVVTAVLAMVVVERRALLPRWRTLVVAAVPVGVLSAVPMCFFALNTSVGNQALAAGASARNSTAAMLGVTIGSLAALAAPAALRQRRLRTVGLTMLASAAMVTLFSAYQMMKLGTTGYYFNKLGNVYLLLGTVCSVTLVTFLGPARDPDRWSRRGRLRETMLGLIALGLAFTSIGGFGIGYKPSDVLTPQWRATPLGRWYSGYARDGHALKAAEQLRQIDERGLLRDGTPTIFLLNNEGYLNWRVTYFNGIFNRTSGVTIRPVNNVIRIPIGAAPFDPEKSAPALAELEKSLSTSPVPLRIVVRDPETAAAVQRLIDSRPDLRATVVLLGV